MAIYHLSMKPVARATGRSAVAAAAYRAADCLLNERDGLTHDFTQRSGVAHTEILLPAGCDATWALDRSALWNAAEASETRKDARVARELELALPHELSEAQRLALTRDFAQGLADRYGVAVDIALHAPHGDAEIRNHHAHLLLTTRQVGPEGLLEKSPLEWDNKRLLAQGLPSSHAQLRTIRQDWAEVANVALAHAGLDLRIDHRSHQDRGLELAPTQHQGVQATQMERRGLVVTRVRLEAEAAAHNAALIRSDPVQVLTLITQEQSVFDRRDVARVLHRYLDGPEAFQAAFARVMGSSALVELQAEQRDASGRVLAPARLSTHELVALERSMAEQADSLALGAGYRVRERCIEAALRSRPFLAAEQCQGIRHVTGPEAIAALVGLAGAGKSTLLEGAREAWEGAGYRVQGAALAGKAAEGLEEASGIPSRTLASWERSWARGFDRLGPGDVLVIDEAGMIGSRQLAHVVSEIARAGAKLVLVGDPEQLQPIGPGAAFRAIAERVGFVTLEAIRRQQSDWQRAAAVDFGCHRTAQGLRAYAEQGAIQFSDGPEQTLSAVVAAVMADEAQHPEGSRLVMAHRRIDVLALNQAIRAARQDQGLLGEGQSYPTQDGERAFAPSDRIQFRENDRALGVKNGQLGTVEQAHAGQLLVRLDSAQGPGTGRAVQVDLATYAALDHGYATTLHKAQGATVACSFVLASPSLDRHLTYVGMTRHRQNAQLHVDRRQFPDLEALCARLSRAQRKETTLDYGAEGYAARRGLEGCQAQEPGWDQGSRAQRSRDAGQTPEPRTGVDPPPTAPRQPSPFDGLVLDLGALAAPSQDQGRAARLAQTFASEAAAFERALEGYARAWADAERMRAQALPVLPHQALALERAGAALEGQRPGASQLLAGALQHQPGLAQAVQELKGAARVAQLREGFDQEARVQRDPRQRAQRLVTAWQGLEAERVTLGFSPESCRSRLAIEDQQRALLTPLKADPELAALLRQQGPVLGIASGSRLALELRALERAHQRTQDHSQGWDLS
jgi:Ti-type conjugative transfer relaxase TraA